MEKKFGHRSLLLGYAQLATNELVIGEDRSFRVQLKESGELHLSVCAVDFGLEKRKEEKKAPVVEEFDDDMNRQFDLLLVCYYHCA